MYGIPDLTMTSLSFYEFGKFLFLPTIIVVSRNQELKSNGRISVHIQIFRNLEYSYIAHKKISFQAGTF